VPKRHAKRAVTRTLIKRQIRSAAQRIDDGAGGLEPGLWVVRLRAPFDRMLFTSAASSVLRSAARVEIDALFSKCCART
jgi:ribonuclease P protein component